MANGITRTVELIFGATDNTGDVLNDLSSNLNAFDAGIQAFAEPFANFTKGLLATEASIAVLGGALVSFSINEAGTFKTGVSEIAALFNATSDQSDQLAQDILGFATTSKFAIEDINSATFTAISTGTEWTKVTDLLAESQVLAVGGSSDLSSATELLSRSLNIYGDEAGTATEAAEALFVAAQQGDTNFTELSSTLGKLLQPAKSASVGFEEMLAAVAAVTIGTGNTAESMTLLKSLFKELASPSAELTEALGGMNLESNTLHEIMQQLQTSTGGQFAAMDKLFGSTEAVNGALILATDTSGKFESSLIAMEEKTGKLTASYNRMKDDFAGINQNLVNNLRATLIKVGLPLLDEYGTAAGALAGIFKTVGIEIESGALKPLSLAMETFAKNASETLQGIGDALPDALDQLDFSKLLDSFDDLGNEFGNVFDAIFGDDLDLTKPEDLAKALQKAVDITRTFVNLTKSIIEDFRPVFEALGEAGKRVGEVSDDTVASTGKFLATMTLLSEFGTALGTLMIIIRETGTDVENIFNTLAGASKILINVVQSSFDLVVGTVAHSLGLVAEAFEAITPDVIGDPWGKIADELNLLGDAADANFVRNMSDAGDGLDQLGAGLSLLDEKTTDTAPALDKFTEGLGEVTESTKLTDEEINKLVDSVHGTDAEIETMLDSLYGTGNAMHSLAEETSNSGFELIKYRGSSDAATDSTNKNKDATDALSESQKIATQNAHEMDLALAELASKENIANLQFNSEIQVAQIQADASQVVAAYDAIGVSISSTNDLIGTLFSHDAPDWDFGGWDTKQAAQEAMQRAEELHDSQMALNDSTIDLMRARIDAMARGDSKVTIDVQNAEPEMQLLLKSLFEFIMVKANAEGMELLTL